MDQYQKFIKSFDKKFLLTDQLKLNESLAFHTTFKLGGPAKIFLAAKTGEELVKVVSLCRKLSLPFLILGQGSNILIGDSGFKGVVIKNKAKKIKILGYKGKVRNLRIKVKNIFVEASSGVFVNQLVRYTLNEGLEGLENFLGLPGTIGGAIYTNAHNLKVGDFFGDHLTEAYLLTSSSKVKKVTQEYFDFSYDKSKIQHTGEVVLSAIFSLKLADKTKLWKKANEVMDYRLRTQPLGKFSAGCIFKNIKKSEAMRASTPGFTTSAGFLIEAAGLKGKKIGGAQVSTVHANFIVNLGRATASDVIKLIEIIKKKVKEKFGVRLEEEIKMTGEF